MTSKINGNKKLNVRSLKNDKIFLTALAALLLLCIIIAPASAAVRDVPVGLTEIYKNVSQAVDYISGQNDSDEYKIILTSNTIENRTSDPKKSQVGDINRTITITTDGNPRTISSNGQCFNLVSGGNLTLEGNGTSGILTIDGNDVLTDSKGLIYIDNSAQLTLNDGVKLTKGNSGYGGGAVYVKGGSFIMNGGDIIGNVALCNGGGVFIASSCTFTMSGGNITDNKVTQVTEGNGNGGGVYNKGKFTMTGGTISNNTATQNGGGVYVAGTDCTFTMSGSADIRDNIVSDGSGGGVRLASGKFIMDGGNISNNTATKLGGGVYAQYGTFIMTGGTIGGDKPNTAGENGSGAVIKIFNIKASANITENNDVYLNDSGAITLTGAMNEGKGILNITPENTTIGYTAVKGTVSYPALLANFRLNQSMVDIKLRVNANDLYIGPFQDPNVEIVETGNTYSTVYNAVDAMDKLSPALTEATLKILNNTVEDTTINVGSKKINITASESYTITKAFASADNSLFTVDNGGSLCINSTAGTLTIDGNKSDVNKANAGGLIYVKRGGNLTLQNGANLTNASAKSGGAVYIYSGTFNMDGGNITDSTAYYEIEGGNGGGVVLGGDGCIFTMRGGSITGCTAINITTQGGYGGGVTVGGNCIFIMDGGIIGGTNPNSARYGGGVWVGNEGSFTLSGDAEIQGNTATESGGGIYNYYEFTMTGGTISGNTAAKSGGGIYISTSGTFQISGGANVTADNDVYLPRGKYITQAAAMNEGKGIFSIYPANTTKGAKVVTNESGSGELNTANFVLNKTYAETNNLKLELNDANSQELVLAQAIPLNKLHNSSRGIITADLLGGGITNVDGITLVGTAPLGFTFDPATKAYTIADTVEADNVTFSLGGTNIKIDIERRANLETNKDAWDAAVGGEKLKLNFTLNGSVKHVTPANITRGTYTAVTNLSFVTVTNITPATPVVLVNDTDYHITDDGNINLTAPVYDNVYKYAYLGRPLGDVNNDGVVDIVDAAVIGIYTIKGDEITLLKDEDKVYAKTMDGNENIGVADILKVHAYIAAL